MIISGLKKYRGNNIIAIVYYEYFIF